MPFLGTPYIVRVVTQFDKTSDTTLATVTGLTIPADDIIVQGGVYDFYAELFTTSNVAGGVKATIAGSATATAIRYQTLIIDGAAAVPVTNGRSTALAGAGVGVTAVTVALIQMFGRIQVNAPGTLLVQFAQNASNGAASSVLPSSKFQLSRIYNTIQQPWEEPATS